MFLSKGGMVGKLNSSLGLSFATDLHIIIQNLKSYSENRKEKETSA